MRALLWVLTVVLFLTGMALAVLTIGTFASLVPNGGTSLWLRSLGGIETLLSARLNLDSLPGFTRATLMVIVTGLIFALSAYIKPRS
ncbi:hypothetical protein DEDE109153_02650 [Deinococcus deserti]|uniref:Uncharacterized protein n=1 Tax=Deinococcus deserti (strain DSM 17065 / CIP 109153 / LMG 22923 / VCD115) TaxID=546414 RepID=C1CUT2_DEIDV|nr:hypothetical protein [Deinococcus deserti]ACO45949.1 conserved hypothetical protein, precursor [Deinococcus deserti VCD115]